MVVGGTVHFAVAVCLKLTPLAGSVLLLVNPVAWAAGLATVGCHGWVFLLPFLTRPSDLVFDHYRGWIDDLDEVGNIRWLVFAMVGQSRSSFNICLAAAGRFDLGEPMDSFGYRLVQLTTASSVLVWCLWQQFGPNATHWNIVRACPVALSMGLAWLMLFGPAVRATPPMSSSRRRCCGGCWRAGPGRWSRTDLGMVAVIMVLGWGVVTRFLSPDWPVLLTALPAGTALFALWLVGYAQTAGGADPKFVHVFCGFASPVYHRATPGSERRDETVIPS